MSMRILNINVGDMSKQWILDFLSSLSSILKEKEPDTEFILVPVSSEGIGKIHEVSGSESIVISVDDDVVDVPIEDIVEHVRKFLKK